MTRLVFWYGTPEDDLSGGYSFVPCTKITNCERGCEDSNPEIPQKIQKKLETGKRLTANETMLVKGLEQISADVKLEPSERSPWLFDFDEDYEDFLAESDDETSVEEEIVEPPIDSEKKKKRRKKKDQNSKEKTLSKTETDPAVSKQKRKRKSEGAQASKKSKKSKTSEGEIEQPSKKPKKLEVVDEDVKVMRKNLKKSKLQDEEIKTSSKKAKEAKLQDIEIKVSSKHPKKSKGQDEKIKLSSKKAKKSLLLDEEIAQEVAEEDAVMNIDASSEDDEDDDDFCDKEDSETEDEEDEEELYEKGEDPLSAKKKTKVKSASSKHKAKKKTLKSSEEIEQELFENCEKLFLPLMNKLQDVDTEENAEKLLKKIDRDVQKLTPSFFKSHQIGLVVKEVRSRFKDNTLLNQLCKQITSKMKTIYRDKLEFEPKGFEPKVNKQKKKIARKSVERVKEKGRNEVPQGRSPPPVPLEEEGSTQSQESNKQSLGAPSAVPNKSSILKKENVESFSDPQVPPKKTPKATKPKAKAPRKSFSLAGMIDRKPTPTPSSTISSEKKSEAEPELPEWIIKYQRTGDSFETNPDRIFALEFLMDAVSCLPKGKCDPLSVARAIEDAVYTKYEDDNDRYMERLHDICAAISGKKQMGSLVQKIAAGDYATPLDVISLPRKILFRSFEGFWIP